MSEKEGAGKGMSIGNTRVKVIPVSAIAPVRKHSRRTSGMRLSSAQVTTFLDSEAETARGSGSAPPTSNVTVAPSQQRTFLRRRMEVWDVEHDEPSSSSRRFTAGSIAALPISMQAGFRRKVLFIFDLQLLLLTGAISLLTYESNLSSLMQQIFYTEWILLIAFGVMVLALVLLYRFYAVYPMNWIAMVLFTAVFSILIAGAQVVLDTNVGIFCSTFTFLAMCVMTFLCGLTQLKGNETVFLSSHVAGFVSYSIVAVGSGIVYGAIKWEFLSTHVFAYALVIEFALIVWFSYDATTIFRLITPDEYMHGVIYFYTDVLVLTMISAAAIALVLLCTACGGASGGGGGLGYINPTGCSSGCCSCCADGDPDDGEEDDVQGVLPAQQQDEVMVRG